MSPPRPDLVLIMTDQQRFDQVGYAGDTVLETPHLDRLAADGVAFEAAYSGSTTCVPARTALLTGLLDHRVPHVERYVIEPDTWTVPHALRTAGYQTALVGKMHFRPIRAEHGFDEMRTCEHLDAYPGGARALTQLDHYHDWLLDQGVPDWRLDGEREETYHLDIDTHPTSWVRDQALDVLRGRDPDRPLFLVISFPHPHPPVNPPEPYASRYDPADCPVDPEGYLANRFLPRPWRDATAQADAPHRRVQADRLDAHRASLARTYGLITQIDDAVGVIVDHLSLPDTVLGFTADHGDFAGRRGLVRKVPWIPFDDLARVPCFVTGGPVVGGRVVSEPMQSFDLAATWLDYAGVDLGDVALDAVSLRPLVEDPTWQPASGRCVFSALTMDYPMVRRGPHKYILGPWGARVLFDVERDPDEVFNLESLEGASEIMAELEAALVDREAAAVPDLPRFPT